MKSFFNLRICPAYQKWALVLVFAVIALGFVVPTTIATAARIDSVVANSIFPKQTADLSDSAVPSLSDGFTYIGNDANPTENFGTSPNGSQTLAFGGMNWRIVQKCDAEAHSVPYLPTDPNCTASTRNTLTLLADNARYVRPILCSDNQHVEWENSSAYRNLNWDNYYSGSNPPTDFLCDHWYTSPPGNFLADNQFTLEEQAAVVGERTIPSRNELDTGNYFGIDFLNDYTKYTITNPIVTHTVAEHATETKCYWDPMMHHNDCYDDRKVTYYWGFGADINNQNVHLTKQKHYESQQILPLIRINVSTIQYIQHLPNSHSIQLGFTDEGLGDLPPPVAPITTSSQPVQVGFGWSFNLTLSESDSVGTEVWGHFYSIGGLEVGRLLRNNCVGSTCTFSTAGLEASAHFEYYMLKIFLHKGGSDLHSNSLSPPQFWQTIYFVIEPPSADAPELQVDFVNETISGFEVGAKYSIIQGRYFIQTCDNTPAPYEPATETVNFSAELDGQWQYFDKMQFAKCLDSESTQYTNPIDFSYPVDPSYNNGYYLFTPTFTDESTRIVVAKGFEYATKTTTCELNNSAYLGSRFQAEEITVNVTQTYCIRQMATNTSNYGTGGHRHSHAVEIEPQIGTVQRDWKAIITTPDIFTSETNQQVNIMSWHKDDNSTNREQLLSLRNVGNQPLSEIQVQYNTGSPSQFVNADFELNVGADVATSDCNTTKLYSDGSCTVHLVKHFDQGDELSNLLKFNPHNNFIPSYVQWPFSFKFDGQAGSEIDLNFAMNLLEPSIGTQPTAPDNQSIRIKLSTQTNSVTAFWSEPANFGTSDGQTSSTLSTYKVKVTEREQRNGSGVGSCNGSQVALLERNIICTGLVVGHVYSIYVMAVNQDAQTGSDWSTASTINFVTRNPVAWTGATIPIDAIKTYGSRKIIRFTGTDYYVLGYKQCTDNTEHIYARWGVDSPCDSAILLKKNLGNANSGIGETIKFSESGNSYSTSNLRNQINEIYNSHKDETYNNTKLSDVIYNISGKSGFEGLTSDDKMWALSNAQATMTDIYGFDFRSEFIIHDISDQTDYGTNGHGSYERRTHIDCYYIAESLNCFGNELVELKNAWGWWLRSSGSSSDKAWVIDTNYRKHIFENHNVISQASVNTYNDDSNTNCSANGMAGIICKQLTYEDQGYAARPAVAIHINTYNTVEPPISPNPETIPSISIDYINQLANNIVANSQYSLNFNYTFQSVASTMSAFSLTYLPQFGTTNSLNIVKKGTGQTDDSQVQHLTVNQRGSPPVLGINYFISPVQYANQYADIRLNNGFEWSVAKPYSDGLACPRVNNWVTSELSHGDSTKQTYCLRKSATTTTFASDAVKVEVTAGEIPLVQITNSVREASNIGTITLTAYGTAENYNVYYKYTELNDNQSCATLNIDSANVHDNNTYKQFTTGVSDTIRYEALSTTNRYCFGAIAVDGFGWLETEIVEKALIYGYTPEPEVAIDYENELLNNFDININYYITGETGSEQLYHPRNATVPITQFATIPDYNSANNTIILHTTSKAEYTDSPTKTLVIPARPQTPIPGTDFGVVDPNFQSEQTAVTIHSGYEWVFIGEDMICDNPTLIYRKVISASQAIAGSERVGDICIRKSATPSAFKSLSFQANVVSGDGYRILSAPELSGNAVSDFTQTVTITNSSDVEGIVTKYTTDGSTPNCSTEANTNVITYTSPVELGLTKANPVRSIFAITCPPAVNPQLWQPSPIIGQTYKLNIYTLQFDLNYTHNFGQALLPKQTYIIGDIVALPLTASRPDYDFIGWAIGKNRYSRSEIFLETTYSHSVPDKLFALWQLKAPATPVIDYIQEQLQLTANSNSQTFVIGQFYNNSLIYRPNQLHLQPSNTVPILEEWMGKTIAIAQVDEDNPNWSSHYISFDIPSRSVAPVKDVDFQVTEPEGNANYTNLIVHKYIEYAVVLATTNFEDSEISELNSQLETSDNTSEPTAQVSEFSSSVQPTGCPLNVFEYHVDNNFNTVLLGSNAYNRVCLRHQASPSEFHSVATVVPIRRGVELNPYNPPTIDQVPNEDTLNASNQSDSIIPTEDVISNQLAGTGVELNWWLLFLMLLTAASCTCLFAKCRIASR